MRFSSRICMLCLVALGGATEAADRTLAPLAASALGAVESTAAPAAHLSEAGFFVPGSTTPRPEYLGFSPQYPLWSDGARKRRWLHIPAGSTIDASDPDAWVFPPGTRLWKEFAHARPVETRLIERLPDGSWRFLSYVWNADGSDAELAAEAGMKSLPAEGSQDGLYTIPSRDDCRACHEGSAVPVLGVGALQLSPDRDPLAPHAEPTRPEDVDLSDLVTRGWLVNLPAAFLDKPPRIDAVSAMGRAALGYLHANCGHCHNESGALDVVDMLLAQRVAPTAAGAGEVLHTLIDQPGDFRAPGLRARVVPGHPEVSTLPARMRSRNPLTQMPPLGTRFMDVEGVALIERWIQYDLSNLKETDR